MSAPTVQTQDNTTLVIRPPSPKATPPSLQSPKDTPPSPKSPKTKPSSPKLAQAKPSSPQLPKALPPSLTLPASALEKNQKHALDPKKPARIVPSPSAPGASSVTLSEFYKDVDNFKKGREAEKAIFSGGELTYPPFSTTMTKDQLTALFSSQVTPANRLARLLAKIEDAATHSVWKCWTTYMGYLDGIKAQYADLINKDFPNSHTVANLSQADKFVASFARDLDQIRKDLARLPVDKEKRPSTEPLWPWLKSWLLLCLKRTCTSSPSTPPPILSIRW